MLERDYVIKDPFHFTGIRGEPEEWSNIPKLMAKYCVRLTQHLSAIIEYSKERSAEETTEHLR